MPRSLHRTWMALAVAAFAVLLVGLLTARDFARSAYADCPASLLSDPEVPRSSDPPGPLVAVPFDEDPASAFPERAFVIRYDTSKRPGYRNVRVLWKHLDPDGRTSMCGTAGVSLGQGEAPEDLRLYRSAEPSTYVVKSFPAPTARGRGPMTGGSVRAIFRLEAHPTRQLQPQRIFTRQHLPGLVVIVAVGALLVALFRSRSAMAYALRVHTWTEALLTPAGIVESELGAVLGTLEPSRLRSVPPGPVLVAPAAIASSAHYREMPSIAQRRVVEGTHARWANATMVRLRDARALAALSTACTLLAFGARLIA